MSESSDKDQIDIIRKLVEKVFKSSITNELYVVTSLLAPYCYDLGHYAGRVGIHDPMIECLCWSPCYKVKDGDSEFAQDFPIIMSDLSALLTRILTEFFYL